jgi:hypothetical protein
MLYPGGLPSPKKKPVKFSITAGGDARIKLPHSFYKTIENEQYRIKAYPAAKQAGKKKES